MSKMRAIRAVHQPVDQAAIILIHQIILPNKQSVKSTDYDWDECSFERFNYCQYCQQFEQQRCSESSGAEKGTSVNGNTTWYKLSSGGWITAAYVKKSVEIPQQILAILATILSVRILTVLLL